MKPSKQAIALEYGRRETPVISARGSGDLAERIIEEARKRGVYIAEDPQLVGLLAQLQVDQEIPEQLYTAVAVILAWAYWLRGMVPGDERKQGANAQASS
jgi:flagellar biosynthesis protein